MTKIKKICVLGLLIIALAPLFLARAQDDAPQEPAPQEAAVQDSAPQTFKARVLEVTKTETKTREDGSTYQQQDLKLVGLEGEWKNKIFEFHGISEIEVANAQSYKPGDKVYVDTYQTEDGPVYYVTDLVRTGTLIWLAIIFLIVALAVGGGKSFRAILGLVLSFAVIIYFILPRILSGSDPFVTSLIGSLLIMFAIIYITEGFRRKSHLAILSVLVSLTATLVLSHLFSLWLGLTGMAQEESSFLLGIGQAQIDFRGLLLAGVLIGAVGVLDDIVLGQIEAVESLRLANPGLSSGRIFRLAYRVGNTHLGAIINTLFLTYAGAALPLLLLFVINRQSGVDFSRFFNTEVISTEILRTLVGSIGVMLSMPVATLLASYWHSKK